jgi:predicted CoA-substrate-specific enzyme activase
MTGEKNRQDNCGRCYFDGLEIGAISVKWVRRSEDGSTFTEFVRHGGNPENTVREIFERTNSEKSYPIAVTGQTARALLNLPYRSETECLEKALTFLDLNPDILISLGGETFSVYPLKDGMIRNIISTTKCAAGTGEFIVQQFERMGLSLEEGLAAGSTGKVVKLATRCSVHCKSDATHKLNKGECTPNDIAKSLIHDLAERVHKMVESAQWPVRSLVVCGGVALNELFVAELREIFTDSDITVPEQAPYLEAFGASLLASELEEGITIPPRDEWFSKAKTKLESLPPLREAEPLLDYRVRAAAERRMVKDGSYILGIDAGSTTTKAVLLNVSDGSVGASCYLRTLGNPVAAAKNCIEELIGQVGGEPIKVILAAVTGSGREMVSVYLDNCRSFNEILAHARAAAEEAPDVDTVFEIGGQDSKFISFLNGVPIDYAMNEGCSAGTGSFIEESASVDMGVPVEEISGMAEAGEHPTAFGERCAAFINTDLRNALQRGADRNDVVAGLVYSISDNYVSRIVGPRHIGETLLFLGGVALNRSVALAIAARTQRHVIVPSHPELMGSVGTALMARDLLRDGELTAESLELESLAQGEMEVKGTFRCKACENDCEIRQITIRGKVYPFGGLCSKYEQQRHKGKPTKEGIDLIAARNKMMFEEFGPRPVDSPRGTIGLPMALTAFDLFPFYAKLINELGYEIVLSEPSKIGAAKATAPICYPCEIAHGAVFDLLERGVDFIFMPRVIEMEIADDALHGYTCPSTTLIPDIIRAAFDDLEERVLAPHIGLSEHLIETTMGQIAGMAPALGVTEDAARTAAKKALEHYEEFKQHYTEWSEKEFEKLSGEPTVIVAGRSYITCSPDVNLALPRKIASRGYHVVSADMLPPLEGVLPERDVWYFTQQISNAVAHANRTPNVYICLVSCFSCGPDASMYHYFRQELAGHTFCYLEIDSHTAHAGFETRVGAFLDIVEERRRKQAREPETEPGVGVPAKPTGQQVVRQARLSDEQDYIIDSDGQRVDYDDPRIVHIMTVDVSPIAKRLARKVYEISGRKFRVADQTGPEIMQHARKMCSGRECVPMTAMAGVALKDIQNGRDDDEISIYFTLNQEGPCQNGAWPLIWETFGKRLNARNVIFGIWSGEKNNYLGLSNMHNIAINGAIILGDLFEEARNTLACLARDKESAMETFEAELDNFINGFTVDQAELEKALEKWAEAVAKIPLAAAVEETPRVLIIGGLNLLFVHYPVTEFFLEHGVLPKVVPFSEGLSWLTSEDVVRYGFEKGLVDAKEAFEHSPHGADQEDAVGAREARFRLHFVDMIENQLGGIIAKSGLTFATHESYVDVVEAGSSHASHIGFNETTVTTGRYKISADDDAYDGIINLGSFNCAPAMNSQAVIRPLANRSDMPYAAIDCEGPWLSTNQRRLLETVAVQAKRLRKEKLAPRPAVAK